MKNSVCVAVYNGELYLKEQLDSVLVQLKENDEIIIVDDGSKDKSLKIIDSLQDSRIKVYRNVKNLGPQETFERALGFATGDIIFFCDQDDIWAPNKVFEFTQVFIQTGCAAVVSDASIIDEMGQIKAKSFFELRNSGPGLLKNFAKNTYLGCCMAIDKKAKAWILPFPHRITQHDEWIGLVCDFMDRVVFLDKPLTLYRRHSSNTSSAKRLPMQRVIANRCNMLLAILIHFPKLYRRKGA